MKHVRIYINGTSKFAPMLIEDDEVDRIRVRYESFGHKVVILEKEGGSDVPPKPTISEETK